MHRNTILASAVGLVLASLYGCAPSPMPFDPALMQQNTRKASRTLTTQPMYPLPTTLDTTYAPIRPDRPTTQPATQPVFGNPLNNDPILRLTLQEVLHRAINNNMDIRVSGYDPGINSNRVVEAEARFDPTFFFSPYYEWRNFQNNPAFQTATIEGARQRFQLYGGAVGLRQDLESGGTYELRHETNSIQQLSSSSSQFSTTQSPYFSNNLVAEIKQPLLQNFGTEVNRARISVARNDQKISLLEFRKQVEDSLFKVEQTYWQLLQAQRDVEIGEKLLAASVDTAERLTQRTTQDITRVETSQANARVQTNRALLVGAYSRVRSISNQLKQLMNDPTLPVSGNILILPATEPIQQEIHFDPQEQINQALEHRFELAEQILKIDSQSLINRVAKNNLLPSLQIVNSLTFNGSETDWTGANARIASGSFTTDRVGLQLEVPIGNRQARAVYQRTLLQRQQAIDTYRSLIDQVSLEVRNALLNVDTAWEQIRMNRQAAFATADALEAILLRERNREPLNYSFVTLKLDTQARLADAERATAEAVANYCLAIAQLERAKGTLLRYDNVMMQEDRLSVLSREKIRENIPEPLQLMPAKDSTVQPGPNLPPVMMPTLDDVPSR
jgi:outer membrane protein